MAAAIKIVAYALLVMSVHPSTTAEDISAVRASRSLRDIWPISTFFGKEEEPVPQVHPALHEYPLWKVHKYSGIQIKPVPLASLPYIQVPVEVSTPAPPRLPSLQKIKTLLGTTTNAETFRAIHEIASTREGLKFIASFVKASLGTENISDEQVGALVSNFMHTAQAGKRPASYPRPQLTSPLLYQYGVPHQAPIPVTYGTPSGGGFPPPAPVAPPPQMYGPPAQKTTPPPIVYGKPKLQEASGPQSFAVQAAPMTVSADAISDLISESQENMGQDFILPSEEVVGAFNVEISPEAKPKSKPYPPERQSQDNKYQEFVIPSEKVMESFKFDNPIDAYSPPTSASPSMITHQDASQEFILPSDDAMESFNVPPAFDTYGPPKQTSGQSQEGNAQEFPQSAGGMNYKIENPTDTYGLPPASQAGPIVVTRINEAQEFILPAEGAMESFRVQVPFETYGPPPSSADEQQGNENIAQEFEEADEKVTDNTQIGTPAETYGEPEFHSPSFSGIQPASEMVEYTRPKVPSETYSQPPEKVYGLPQGSTNLSQKPIFVVDQVSEQNAKPLSENVYLSTYPGYEPTMVNNPDVERMVGSVIIPYPELPGFTSPNDGVQSQHDSITSYLDTEKAVSLGSPALQYEDVPLAGFSAYSAPARAQHVQHMSVVPSNDNSNFMLAVHQASSVTGIPAAYYNQNQHFRTGPSARPSVVETKYDQPGFSYTQLSKIPLETGSAFRPIQGLRSSYGDSISTHIFQGDSLPAGSEKQIVITPAENKKEDARPSDSRQPDKPKAEHYNKMVVEQKSVVASNASNKSRYQRRPWMPKSKRKSHTEVERSTTVVYAESMPNENTEVKLPMGPK